MTHPTLTLDHIEQRLAAHDARTIEGPEFEAAAVAVTLRETDRGVEALFIRRAEHPQDRWSGHMAFPGGKVDAEDAGRQQAAVRETLEEVGVDLAADARPIGRLDDLQAMARGRLLTMAVSPYVYALQRPVELTLDETEVSECVWIPLAPLLAGEHDSEIPWKFGAAGVMLPCFQVGPHCIWGLTWRMLANLFSLVAPREELARRWGAAQG